MVVVGGVSLCPEVLGNNLANHTSHLLTQAWQTPEGGNLTLSSLQGPQLHLGLNPGLGLQTHGSGAKSSGVRP